MENVDKIATKNKQKTLIVSFLALVILFIVLFYLVYRFIPQILTSIAPKIFIPSSVSSGYEKDFGDTLSVCQNGHGVIYKIDWSNSFEKGSNYFSSRGERIGNTTFVETSDTSVFNITGYSCNIIKQK